MRIAYTVLIAAIAFPAAALAAPPPADRTAQAAAALQNPIVQDGIARAVTQLAGIVLDTRIGPMAALADPEADAHSDETLRDLAQHDDPDLERHLYERTRHSVATAGVVAGGVSQQAAAIAVTADRLNAALAPLIAAVRQHGHAPEAVR